MADFQSPGNSVTERRKGLVSVPAVAYGRAAFLGLAEKGPIAKPILITAGDFEEVFGKPIAQSYLADAVSQFFNEGGESCYVVRTEHYNAGVLQATAATRALNSGATLALTINASSPGTWANGYTITTTRVNRVVTTTRGNVAAGSTSTIPVESLSRISIGDVLSITSGSDTQRGRVTSVDTANRTVTFASAVTVPSGGYATPTNVVLEVLDIFVYNLDGDVEEVFRDLRMHSAAGPKFINNVINNVPRCSITVDSEELAVSSTVDARPTDVTGSTLASGTSGIASIADTDFVGTSSAGTGLYAFDAVDDFLIGPMVPGVCTVAVQKGIESYVETRANSFAILEVPQGYSPSQANTYVTTTANLASSYAGIYYPWIKVVDTVNGGTISMPPCGMLAGMFARTFARRNFGKAPAGVVDGRLTQALDLDYEVKKAEYDTLYPNKINAILKKRSNGIVSFGAKTLDPTGEYGSIPVRIVFLVVARVFREGTEWVNFEDNTEETRSRVTRFMRSYLRGLRTNGVLAGEKDDDAFFIVCDSSNNTPSVRRSGKLVARIGLAKDNPVEFIEMTLEQDTRALDAELASGR